MRGLQSKALSRAKRAEVELNAFETVYRKAKEREKTAKNRIKIKEKDRDKDKERLEKEREKVASRQREAEVDAFREGREKERAERTVFPVVKIKREYSGEQCLWDASSFLRLISLEQHRHARCRRCRYQSVSQTFTQRKSKAVSQPSFKLTPAALELTLLRSDKTRLLLKPQRSRPPLCHILWPVRHLISSTSKRKQSGNAQMIVTTMPNPSVCGS